MRVTLGALEQAIAGNLAQHPEVAARRWHAGQTEFLELAIETGPPPYRSIRIAVADLPGQGEVYSMRWSFYRNARQEDDTDGGTYGDLEFTRRALQHWMFDQLDPNDVPEFRG